MVLWWYKFGVNVYNLGIRLAAKAGNEKAKQWSDGRKNIWNRLSTDFQKNKASVLWVHCASLGEFEQGRPVIEHFRKQHPDYKILLTFFSPSGYEIRKNYPHADWVYYLPMDHPEAAKRFLEIVTPDLAIFVKYEFWYYYIDALHKKNIPTLLISAVFRPDQFFFKWYGQRFLPLLEKYAQIFVQDPSSVQLLDSKGIKTNVTRAGDTRLDRVLEIKAQAKRFPFIEQFTASAPTWICGSSWPAGEELLIPFFKKQVIPKGWKIVIAPHEIDDNHIQKLSTLIQKNKLSVIRYTQKKQYSTTEIADAQILIVDTIGMLSALYQYAEVVYIGGGFGVQIHNILEPLVFEVPIAFGPRHEKFKDATVLINRGVADCIENTETLQKFWDKVEPVKKRIEIAAAARKYCMEYKGATSKILEYIDGVLEKK